MSIGMALAAVPGRHINHRACLVRKACLYITTIAVHLLGILVVAAHVSQWLDRCIAMLDATGSYIDERCFE